MADQAHQEPEFANLPKGKGKPATQEMEDVSMGEDDDEEEEEDHEAEEEEEAEPDEDGLEEIDTNNIVNTGRRTRGKVIDFAAAAEKEQLPAEEEDEEEDDDYEAPDEEMEG